MKPTTGRGQSTGPRSGFTLLELLLVVVLMGIILAMTAPRIGAAAARRGVVGATSGFEALFRRARATAIQNRLPATITFASGRATVTIIRSGTSQVVGQVLDFPDQYNLTPTVTANTLRIEPTGLVVSGTPYSFIATRQGEADTVMITGYGRIQ